MEYRHTQNSYAAVFVLLWLAIVFVVVLVNAGGDEPLLAVATGGLMAIIALVVIAFSRLIVTIAAGEIRAAFTFGWPRRTIDILSVAGFRPVRNKWYYGWGIRKVPGGWMYNVWGLDAVELDLHSGKKFRIGTDEPEDLVAALTLHTSMRPSSES